MEINNLTNNRLKLLKLLRDIETASALLSRKIKNTYLLIFNSNMLKINKTMRSIFFGVSPVRLQSNANFFFITYYPSLTSDFWLESHI
jgi:hypothetical protein